MQNSMKYMSDTETMKAKYDIEQLLAQGQAIRIKPQGYSMYPFLVPGRDEAVIAPLRRQVRRGDVVLFRREGSILVLHRVWKCGKNGIYLVGDNQTAVEGPVDAARVKGILTDVVRRDRRFGADHPVYRFLSGLWLWLRPFRPALSCSAAAIKRLWNGL